MITAKNYSLLKKSGLFFNLRNSVLVIKNTFACGDYEAPTFGKNMSNIKLPKAVIAVNNLLKFAFTASK